MSRKRLGEDLSSSSETCQHGCGQLFTLENNRVRHERYFCPVLDNSSQGTPLASHTSLGILDTECRVCGERSSRKDSTKRHERVAHGVIFSQSGSAFLPSSSSYATCPSPQSGSHFNSSTHQTVPAQDSDTTLTDVDLSVNNAEFEYRVVIPTTLSPNTLITPTSHIPLTSTTSVSSTAPAYLHDNLANLPPASLHSADILLQQACLLPATPTSAVPSDIQDSGSNTQGITLSHIIFVSNRSSRSHNVDLKIRAVKSESYSQSLSILCFVYL